MKTKHCVWWKKLWDERSQAVLSLLGDTQPPGMVFPYSWKDYSLPGACCMVFGPKSDRADYLYISMGPSQPEAPGRQGFPWEFALRSRENALWPRHVLYDLLTYWLTEPRKVSLGLHLPFVFFRNREGSLCAGVGDPSPELDMVGSIRGLFLWEDQSRVRFHTASGDFGLLAAVAITEDEDRLAQETTPPHLLLLLKEMGVGQLSDPHRQSVMLSSEANERWERIRELPHARVVRELSSAGT